MNSKGGGARGGTTNAEAEQRRRREVPASFRFVMPELARSIGTRVPAT